MTDTMIEEVARAMYEAANLCKTPEYIIPWDMLEEKELPHLKESYFDLARAAIAAIIPEGMVRVPKNTRQWSHYPIEMPTVNGQGPAPISECDKIGYEVWDRGCAEHSSHDTLADAMQATLDAMIQAAEGG